MTGSQGSLVLLGACATVSTAVDVVRERMAEEYSCRRGNMTVTEFAANG